MNRTFFAILAGLLLAAPAAAQETAPCEVSEPVVFAGLDYDSAQFHTAVAQYLIERGFGCEVDAIPGSTIPLLNGIAQGNPQIVMEVWTANPAEPWVEAEKAGKAVALGTTFPDAVEGWYVPTALVSGPNAKAPELKSVADLPKYKDLFADPEEPGKGRFYNCPAGWQCEVVNTKKLAAYGLTDTYTDFRPGTGEALAAVAESAALQNKPILFYYWGPTWLLGKHDFTRLEEPAYDKAKWDAMIAADKPTEATAYPTSRVIIGANAEFAAKAPEITAFLKAYNSTNEATSKALAYMRDSKASAADAAIMFLKENEALWSTWLPADAAARVKADLSS